MTQWEFFLIFMSFAPLSQLLTFFSMISFIVSEAVIHIVGKDKADQENTKSKLGECLRQAANRIKHKKDRRRGGKNMSAKKRLMAPEARLEELLPSGEVSPAEEVVNSEINTSENEGVGLPTITVGANNFEIVGDKVFRNM